MIYRPMYVNRIMKYTDAPFVKILTGIRRSGKSTILKMIINELKKRGIPDERILSYRFDSMEYEDTTAKEMFTEIKSKLSSGEKTYIFLDEVQEINHWEKAVNSLASDDVIRNSNIPDRKIYHIPHLHTFIFRIH